MVFHEISSKIVRGVINFEKRIWIYYLLAICICAPDLFFLYDFDDFFMSISAPGIETFSIYIYAGEQSRRAIEKYQKIVILSIGFAG